MRHTIALVRTQKASIMGAYFVGMGAFFVGVLLQIWIYIGMPNWRQMPLAPATGDMPGSRTSARCPGGPSTGLSGDAACDSYGANGWATSVVRTELGETLVRRGP